MWQSKWMVTWLQQIQERVDAADTPSRMDALLISSLYRIYLLEKQVDELMWRLETAWYQLDSKLFPLPAFKKKELFDDYYLRIPRRLAMRELWHEYKKYDRRVKSYDKAAAFKMYSRKKDIKVVETLFMVMETMRDRMFDLYWKVRLADQ